MSKPEEHIAVSSTCWQKIELMAISNYKDDIEIGKRVKVFYTVQNGENHMHYEKHLSFQMSGDEANKLYEGLKHIYGDCDEDVCEHCEKQRDEH